MSAAYGWIIDKDHLKQEDDPEWLEDEAGTMGPRDISPAHIAELEEGKGKQFKMYDDDSVLYYTGRIVGKYNGSEPLYDFGQPNAGATRITMGGKDIV